MKYQTLEKPIQELIKCLRVKLAIQLFKNVHFDMFLTIQQHSLKHEYYRLNCLVCYVPPICDTLCSETDLMMMMRVMVIGWDLEIILLNVV